MKVILAEKPSVARDIARIVGAYQKRDGYLEGNDYQVTWAFGHLIGIVEPSVMKATWGGKWNFGQLPMIPDTFQLTANKGAEKQFGIITKLFEACDEIINATDAGREGELIFRWIYAHSKSQKSFKRLWISDLTDASIKKGLAQLHAGCDFDRLGDCAQARAFADWIVGLNATRAYTIAGKQLYTVGRVQTPTLALIVNRNAIIQGFNKCYYYELIATAGDVAFRWQNKDGSKIEHKNTAIELKKKCHGHDGEITNVKKTKKKTSPAPLYDLTLLQKECNEKFGYTAQQTLDFAQKLYEQHKLITYPRTESRHLSEAMRDDLPLVLKSTPDELKALAKMAFFRLKEGHKLGKAYIDDKKLTDHHAIIPTQKKLVGELDEPLRNLYFLIQKRFIAIFFADFLENVTEITLVINQEMFKFKGAIVSQLGWREVYVDTSKVFHQDIISTLTLKDDEKEMLLHYPVRKESLIMLKAGFKKGQKVAIESCEVVEKETAPPKAYTDGTLLNAMRYIGRQVDDESLASQLKDQGLGTQATRASIIERLIKSKYIIRKKKTLHPTEKGIGLIQTVIDDLKSPELTAQWEVKLSDIQEGHIDQDTFMNEIKTFTKDLIGQIKNADVSPAAFQSKESLGVCPKCKKGNLYEGHKRYYCSAYRDGCDFVLWWKVASKIVDKEQCLKLINNGRSDLIQGFMSKKGKPFNAILELDKDFKTKFCFNN